MGIFSFLFSGSSYHYPLNEEVSCMQREKDMIFIPFKLFFVNYALYEINNPDLALSGGSWSMRL